MQLTPEETQNKHMKHMNKIMSICIIDLKINNENLHDCISIGISHKHYNKYMRFY